VERLGYRPMSLSRWNEGSYSEHVIDIDWDNWLVGHRKIPALQWAKLPRYGREGAVEVRPFTAETKRYASEAQGLSSEAMTGNPTTTVIPRVDESKPKSSNKPKTWAEPQNPIQEQMTGASGKSPLPLVLCQRRL